MVICQFFLKGACRFGDRCHNEHRWPETRGSYHQGGGRNQKNYQQGSRDYSSGGRHDYNSGRRSGGGYYDRNTYYDDKSYDSYNQGYRNQKNYQQGSRDYSSGGRHDYNSGRSSGGGHFDRNTYYDDKSYDSYNQGYINQKNYYDNRGGYHDGDYDGARGGGRGGYDRSGGQGYSRDKYHYDARDKNRGHQPEPPSFNDSRPFHSRDRKHSSSSVHSVTQDQRADRVRKDMKDWSESGQWPLSCYAPFVKEPCLEGLHDISPEEMRCEAYKANTADEYEQALQQTMKKYSHRKEELATMSSSALQEEISRLSQPSSLVPGGLFGNLASSPQSLGGTSLFGESMSTSTTGLFGPSPQSMRPSGPFVSNPTTTTNPLTILSTSSRPFVSKQNDNTPSMFEVSQEDSSSVQTTIDGAPSTTTTSSKCSEEDLKAFRAEYFVLGAIPECPPPPELC